MREIDNNNYIYNIRIYILKGNLVGKCGPSLSESTTKIWHANKLSEVVTERTENPPVQTTPRLPLRNLIGQWNSLHSNEWNPKKMINFQTFKLNHDFRASYLQHRQTEFSISIMITMPIFSSSVCVCLSDGFSHIGCSRKKLYPVIPPFFG